MLFLVVCKSSVFALALLLGLVVVLCTPGNLFTLWVLFPFSSLVYLYSSLHLSILLSFPMALPRFLLFTILVLFSIFSTSLFRCGYSLQAFPLPFECSHYLSFFCFCHIIFLFWWLLLCCFRHVSPFSGSLPPVSHCFLSFLCLYAWMCVISYSSLFSLFSSFLLFRGLAVFPQLRLLPSHFWWGFSVIYRLPLRCFLLRVPVVFPGWFWRSFQLTLLRCCLSSFPILHGLQPRLLFRLVLFLLPSSVLVLNASFPFHGLCALFSRSLPVRPASLSFCCLSCLVSVPAFVLFFSCTVSSYSSPQFFGLVFLFCTLESFQFFCVFLVPV